VRRVREEHAGDDRNLLSSQTTQDAIILNLQRASETSIDAAMHLVRLHRLGVSQETREAFSLLEPPCTSTGAGRSAGVRQAAAGQPCLLTWRGSRGSMPPTLSPRGSDMAVPAAVRKASKSFYAALTAMAQGDAGPMGAIWSHSATVTTMHPIGGREKGWSKVKAPWTQIAAMCSGGKVTLSSQLIRAVGSMAYEVGVEKGHMVLAGTRIDIEHRVTNVYRREGGAWKIVHHHTDLSPAMIELLARLQAGQA
jgi:ketosteroid isomerase-like protein